MTKSTRSSSKKAATNTTTGATDVTTTAAAITPVNTNKRPLRSTSPAASSSSPLDSKRAKVEMSDEACVEVRAENSEGSEVKVGRDDPVFENEEELDDVELEMMRDTLVDAEVKPGRRAAVEAGTGTMARRVAGVEDTFVGKPIAIDTATDKWPHRYNNVRVNKDGKTVMKALRHYTRAEVDGIVYKLYDDANIKGEEGGPDYIGRIVEFFENTDRQLFFTAQWFFKAADTVIESQVKLVRENRVFYSDIRDENPLNCIISKIIIARAEPNLDAEVKESKLPPCNFYYDMTYSEAFSSFANFPKGKDFAKDYPEQEVSTISSEASCETGVEVDAEPVIKNSSIARCYESTEMTVLDLYAGCGAMSTGLCLGAAKAGVKLVTRWAVDFNKHACEAIRINHPETEVRHETADNFLKLLHEWENLCKEFSLVGTPRANVSQIVILTADEDETDDDASDVPSGEFEVGKLIGVCYGDLNKTGIPGLYFKVHWKGYTSADDTWEPIDGLGKCDGKIKEFVAKGYQNCIIPLPGDVDVICGGPPCQGISGFNRFRNIENPLEDLKNQQVVVYMDIVDFLKPKYVLMENVVDILKMAGGLLGRYALGRLVSMSYQARIGMMAAGCYGLPQYRMRMFMWGALFTEKLPQYPMPTHDVIARGGTPNAFQQCVVLHDKSYKLEEALYLKDAISDLPPVKNSETRDQMPYASQAHTEFQKIIRLPKHELLGSGPSVASTSKPAMLYDHRPLRLNVDDLGRVEQIPKKKGACFRDLPGIFIDEKNIVHWDPEVPRVLLPSGKQLIPDYAMSYIKGRSTKPFARLWWDETVPTVVTRAEPHNQRIVHPEQDRVLSIRENARLQGFPDYYQLSGPVKERYTQVGNAVAVPVARALGYSLGLAIKGVPEDGPLLTLPPKFPNCPVHVEVQASEENGDLEV